MSDVRQAAERLFEWARKHADDQKATAAARKLIGDTYLVAQYVINEHPADDEVEIDEAWLKSCGCSKHQWHPDKWTFKRQDALDVGLWHVDDGWKAMLLFGEHAASCMNRGLKTRGDVRRLASALGITLGQ